MSVKVKMCGITRLADARAAVEAGADLLGFNFCQQSPRFLTLAAAEGIFAAAASTFSMIMLSVISIARLLASMPVSLAILVSVVIRSG